MISIAFVKNPSQYFIVINKYIIKYQIVFLVFDLLEVRLLKGLYPPFNILTFY